MTQQGQDDLQVGQDGLAADIRALAVEVRRLSSRFRRSRTLNSLLVVVVALLAVAVVIGSLGLDKASVAAARNKALATCTNENLSQRNDPTQKDSQAHIAYAAANSVNSAAQLAAGRAELQVLVDPAGSTKQATDFQNFLKVYAAANNAQATFVAASAKYVQTLADDAAARAAHPLGKC